MNPRQPGWVLPGVLIAMMLGVSGCKGPETIGRVDRPASPRPVNLPTYAQVAEGHNRRVTPIDRLWSRATVEAIWYDQEHSKQVESGDDSKVILVMPDRMALTVGKLGQVGLWAGANDTRHWLFDLQEDKRAWVGLNRHIGKPCAMRLPAPMDPRQLPSLMGIAPLPTGDGVKGRVQWRAGYLVVTPPQDPSRPEWRFRLWMHPRSFRVDRVEALDALGRVRLKSQLGQYQRVEMHEQPKQAWPWIATVLEMSSPGRDERLLVRLRDMSDGRARNRIRSAIFDFNRLAKVLKPAKIVQLDEKCRD